MSDQICPVCRNVHGVMDADADGILFAELPEDILIMEEGMGGLQVFDRLDERDNFIQKPFGKEFLELVFPFYLELL